MLQPRTAPNAFCSFKQRSSAQSPFFRKQVETIERMLPDEKLEEWRGLLTHFGAQKWQSACL